MNDYMKLPCRPKVIPYGRLVKRAIKRELLKNNKALSMVENMFLNDLFNSERSYNDCYRDFLDSFKHVADGLTCEYTEINWPYVLSYRPEEDE